MGALGEEFARAFAAKDRERLDGLLAPEIDFRALTPNRFWEAGSAEQVVNEVLRVWLSDEEEVQEVLAVGTGSVADREHVSYRFLVRTPGGLSQFEQQVYYTADRDGRIAWMRVLCSGFQPVSALEPGARRTAG